MVKIIVTAALPYAYSIPHLGNITGSVLPADIYYKYLKMAGADAIFICGSDQHGTPIEIAALRFGVKPEEFANEKHEEIKKAFEDFGITFTYYGKTHTEQNKEMVYKLFKALKNNGYIIEIEDDNPYCNTDKRFVSDRFIEGTCPLCGLGPARGDQCDNCGKLLDPRQIIDPTCKICGKRDIEFKKTKNLAIDYPKLQLKILEFVKKACKNNWSKNAINKTISYIESGLKPVDITRHLKWGFSVPIPKYSDMVFYVWFDAPIGYIGITKEWDAKKWNDYWSDKDTRLIQFLGKDNIQFHTIHWPGMLIGSNLGYVLPYRVVASEFLTVPGGLKFSKSQGRGLDIQNVIKILPADYWRFALIYMYPKTADSTFTIEIFTEIINKLLNDKIGNYIHRVLKLARNNQTFVDLKGMYIDGDWKRKIDRLIESYREHFEKSEIREALHDVLEIADMSNALMNSKEPWVILKNIKIKKDPESVKNFSESIRSLLVSAYILSILLYPFIPSASMNALEYFYINRIPTLDDINKKVDMDLNKEIVALFTKVSKEELKNLLESNNGD